jgi:hypothetical protein
MGILNRIITTSGSTFDMSNNASNAEATFVLVNTNSNAVSVYLPVDNAVDGMTYYIKDSGNAQNNNITIYTDTPTTFTINKQGATMMFLYSSSYGWLEIGTFIIN